MEERLTESFSRFMKINNKIHQMQKRPVKFKDGSVLNTNSIHLIEAIEKNPEANMTELAEILGVTISAISQQIPRLVDDDYIIRYQKDSNDKEYLLKLTDRGKNIFTEHDNIHKEINSKILDDLVGISKDSLDRVDKNLDIINFYLDKYRDEFR